jgi:hypothetical protein
MVVMDSGLATCVAPRNDGENVSKQKPAVMDDGGLFWARRQGWRLFWTRYLPDVLDEEAR